MLRGKVVWYDKHRKYGFIKPLDVGNSFDYFFHKDDLEGEISEGQLTKNRLVKFLAEDSFKGERAKKVSVL